VLRNEPECGITKHRQFSKRIIGGEKAQFAELPWQVGHNIFYMIILGQLKGRFTLDIFARDIAIKRYCDKKITLSHGFLKAKVSS